MFSSQSSSNHNICFPEIPGNVTAELILSHGATCLLISCTVSDYRIVIVHFIINRNQLFLNFCIGYVAFTQQRVTVALDKDVTDYFLYIYDYWYTKDFWISTDAQEKRLLQEAENSRTALGCLTMSVFDGFWQLSCKIFTIIFCNGRYKELVIKNVELWSKVHRMHNAPFQNTENFYDPLR